MLLYRVGNLTELLQLTRLLEESYQPMPSYCALPKPPSTCVASVSFLRSPSLNILSPHLRLTPRSGCVRAPVRALGLFSSCVCRPSLKVYFIQSSVSCSYFYIPVSIPS